jgi:hypothetical protein
MVWLSTVSHSLHMQLYSHVQTQQLQCSHKRHNTFQNTLPSRNPLRKDLQIGDGMVPSGASCTNNWMT